MSFILWTKALIPVNVRHLLFAGAKAVKPLTQGRGRLKLRSVSGLYADTKEMRPASQHEVDRSSAEPN